jgi:hypothetical protein
VNVTAGYLDAGSVCIRHRGSGIDSINRLDDQPTLIDVDFHPLADREASAFEPATAHAQVRNV